MRRHSIERFSANNRLLDMRHTIDHKSINYSSLWTRKNINFLSILIWFDLRFWFWLIFVPFNLQHSFLFTATESTTEWFVLFRFHNGLEWIRIFCEYVTVAVAQFASHVRCATFVTWIVEKQFHVESQHNFKHPIQSTLNTQQISKRRAAAIVAATKRSNRNNCTLVVCSKWMVKMPQFIFFRKYNLFSNYMWLRWRCQRLDGNMNAIFYFNPFNCIWIQMWENRHIASDHTSRMRTKLEWRNRKKKFSGTIRTHDNHHEWSDEQIKMYKNHNSTPWHLRTIMIHCWTFSLR